MTFSSRVVALVVAVLLGVGLMSPAAEAAARADRHVSIKPIEPRPNVFYVKGRARPTNHPLTIIVQRKNCKTCGWFKYKKLRSGDQGGYKARVTGPKRGQARAYYRVTTPKTKRYKQGVSSAFYIYRT